MAGLEHPRAWRTAAVAGHVRLDPLDGGSTEFQYEFQMGGLLGALIQRLRSSVVERGVDNGLSNIVAATSTESTT